MKIKVFALTAALALSFSAQALEINGSIWISGTATLDSQYLSGARNVVAIPGAVVTASDGAYASLPLGTAVSMNGFGWGSSFAPVAPLWTIGPVGGLTYTFDLASLNVVTQNNVDLILTGSGTLYITGAGSPYDADGTFGAYRFSINSANGVAGDPTGRGWNFGFTQSNSTVPDGGVTAMLIGGALTGLAFIRRKLA